MANEECIGCEQCTEINKDLELKAKAFDKLVSILQGREQHVRDMYYANPTPTQYYWTNVGTGDTFNVNVEHRIEPIYEWRLQCQGERDIRKALLKMAEDI